MFPTSFFIIIYLSSTLIVVVTIVPSAFVVTITYIPSTLFVVIPYMPYSFVTVTLLGCWFGCYSFVLIDIMGSSVRSIEFGCMLHSMAMRSGFSLQHCCDLLNWDVGIRYVLCIHIRHIHALFSMCFQIFSYVHMVLINELLDTWKVSIDVNKESPSYLDTRRIQGHLYNGN